MRILKRIFFSLGLAILAYIITSWFLLNGNLTYWTTFNESNIEDSKSAGLFVTQDLDLRFEGDTLNNWTEYFDIWTNKRYEIKYFGFALHWTFYENNWRYLNIEINENAPSEIQELCFTRSDQNEIYKCCDRIGCSVNDTIKLKFIKCQNKVEIGKLEVVIK